jgi:chromosome partitioning protein
VHSPSPAKPTPKTKVKEPPVRSQPKSRSRPRKAKSSRVIAVANQKGGVGKSTTAVSLGAALAELGYRVLVVDLDPQGNASTGLGIRHEAREVTVYDVLAAEAPIEGAIVPTPVSGLFAIPSTIDLAGAEIELVSQFSRELRLRKALEPLKGDEYDFVFLDCPPSLGLLTVNALAAAQELIVPIKCEYYALEGLGQLLRNVGLVQQNVNPDLRLTGIAMTMYDPARSSGAGRPGGAAVLRKRICRLLAPSASRRQDSGSRSRLRPRPRAECYGTWRRRSRRSCRSITAPRSSTSASPRHLPNAPMHAAPLRADADELEAVVEPAEHDEPDGSAEPEAQADAARPRAVEGSTIGSADASEPEQPVGAAEEEPAGGPEDPAVAEVPTLEEPVAEKPAAQGEPQPTGEPAAGPAPEPARDTAREPTGVDPTAHHGVEPPAEPPVQPRPPDADGSESFIAALQAEERPEPEAAQGTLEPTPVREIDLEPEPEPEPPVDPDGVIRIADRDAAGDHGTRGVGGDEDEVEHAGKRRWSLFRRGGTR